MITSQLNASLAGRYVVEREIGQGGMATVYLARDLRHERRVALKVLKPDLGAVVGVDRFLSEIRVTANLQHPNLLPLFDSGEADGLLFYVMPYVEGESLRARLAREKQLPVDEALRITTAVASALGYAHEHGVIHRDLKPENILLQSGQPVIADFGIALAVSNAGGERITQTGLSLGTPQYMSPEQATGDRAIDGRTDIYSLAAMCYEMLTGDPPHTASTAQAVIAKVLTERPRGARLSRPAISVGVERALDRALEKLPADRFATARDFADALSGRTGVPELADAARSSRASRLSTREVVAWSIAGAAAAIAIAAMWRAKPTDALVIRSQMVLPREQRINESTVGNTVTLSPSGDRVVYYAAAAGGNRLYVRRIDQLEGRAITEPNAARSPAFSPDGRWIAYTDGATLMKVSPDGGPAVKLSNLPAGGGLGVSWNNPAIIYVGMGTGVIAVPAEGGEIRPFTKTNAAQNETQHYWPVALSNGKAVLFTDVLGGDVGRPRLAIATVPDGHVRITSIVGTPMAVRDGYVLYTTPTGTVMAAPFNERTLALGQDAIPVVDNVLTDAQAGAKFALSASGDAVYLSGRPETQPVLVSQGKALDQVLVNDPHAYTDPRFSPDGRRIAFTVTTLQSRDIWVFDRDKHTLTRVTTHGGVRPEWTPDGKRLVFVTVFGGAPYSVWWQAADGSSPAEELYHAPEPVFEAIVSPDGQWLVYRTAPGAAHERAVFAVPMHGTKTPTLILHVAPFQILMPRVSYDGHWLAYETNESGRNEVYVRSFPGPGARVQVSSDGGVEPIWSRTGKLYYRQGPDVVAVDVTTGSNFSLGARRVIIDGHLTEYLSNPSHPDYDIAPDGAVLMMRRGGEETKIILVHNWKREMEERLAGAKTGS